MSHYSPLRTIQIGGYFAAAVLLVVLALVFLSSGGGGGASLGGQPSGGRVLTIGPEQTYQTISDAVDAAQPGDILQIYEGAYNESVQTTVPLVIQSADGAEVWIDGECERDIGIRVASGDGTVITGIGVRNTIGPGILIGGSEEDAPHPQHVTVERSTITDFNCEDAEAPENAGIAVSHGRCCMQIMDNTITYRTSGNDGGHSNGIWFANDQDSAGGHYIGGNTIVGGWDAIGGEAVGPDGAFGVGTVIAENTIDGCEHGAIYTDGGEATLYGNEITNCRDYPTEFE